MIFLCNIFGALIQVLKAWNTDFPGIKNFSKILDLESRNHRDFSVFLDEPRFISRLSGLVRDEIGITDRDLG